jgi:hypothetical protein
MIAGTRSGFASKLQSQWTRSPCLTKARETSMMLKVPVLFYSTVIMMIAYRTDEPTYYVRVVGYHYHHTASALLSICGMHGRRVARMRAMIL